MEHGYWITWILRLLFLRCGYLWSDRKFTPQNIAFLIFTAERTWDLIKYTYLNIAAGHSSWNNTFVYLQLYNLLRAREPKQITSFLCNYKQLRTTLVIFARKHMTALRLLRDISGLRFNIFFLLQFKRIYYALFLSLCQCFASSLAISHRYAMFFTPQTGLQ